MEIKMIKNKNDRNSKWSIVLSKPNTPSLICLNFYHKKDARAVLDMIDCNLESISVTTTRSFEFLRDDWDEIEIVELEDIKNGKASW